MPVQSVDPAKALLGAVCFVYFGFNGFGRFRASRETAATSDHSDVFASSHCSAEEKSPPIISDAICIEYIGFASAFSSRYSKASVGVRWLMVLPSVVILSGRHHGANLGLGCVKLSDKRIAGFGECGLSLGVRFNVNH